MTKTVKCRIALAVDPTGKWTAGGGSDDNGQFVDGFDYVLDGLELGEARYYVTVEVPVPNDPEPTEIPGEVEEAFRLDDTVSTEDVNDA